MKKILVVDDDLHIQKLYKEELEEEGYEVIVAGSGVKAMELFVQENPDLVTLDILMPDVDGIKLLRQMKEKNQGFLSSCPLRMTTGTTLLSGLQRRISSSHQTLMS